MGISRSATVVCAYLIATTPMTAPEAIDFVTERRPVVSPNVGFQSQLDVYAERFCTRATTTRQSARLVNAMTKVKGPQERKETVMIEGQSSLVESRPVGSTQT